MSLSKQWKGINNQPSFSDWAEATEMLLALMKLWSGEKSISYPGETPKLQTLFILHTLVAGGAHPNAAAPHTAHTRSSLCWQR